MTSWKEYLARQKAGARDNPMAEAAVAHTDLLEGRSQGALVLLP